MAQLPSKDLVGERANQNEPNSIPSREPAVIKYQKRAQYDPKATQKFKMTNRSIRNWTKRKSSHQNPRSERKQRIKAANQRRRHSKQTTTQNSKPTCTNPSQAKPRHPPFSLSYHENNNKPPPHP
ncbi:uncharacterized protein RSE6_09872 [Rhynchosporium secalis]|uniref:Uncharacterized protein n=1 Tax=Rhynchosporium secalis TaxID=38038 RepID=A0A1E1MJ21_RHYSE|nr:uncharacterized protein RSE6_09872 [Rhynchosporium secalis]